MAGSTRHPLELQGDWLRRDKHGAGQARNDGYSNILIVYTKFETVSWFPRFGRTDVSFKPPRGLKRTINLLDSTTIQLFANCMDWAKHRARKAAAKCHMVLDVRTFLPRFAVVKGADSQDSVVGRILCRALQAGEIVIFDKAYVDFKHLYELCRRGVLWVTRAKTNMSYHIIKKLERTNKSIVLDAKIKLRVPKSKSEYLECFRLIIADVVRNVETVRMEFITDDFSPAASTIAQLYKSRWDIELFFKQIKQTLTLSDFLGYSENAVQWQVWMALLCYLILRFIAFTNKWKGTFARLFTIIRGVIWNRFHLGELLKFCGIASKPIRVIM